MLQNISIQIATIKNGAMSFFHTVTRYTPKRSRWINFHSNVFWSPLPLPYQAYTSFINKLWHLLFCTLPGIGGGGGSGRKFGFIIEINLRRCFVNALMSPLCSIICFRTSVPYLLLNQFEKRLLKTRQKLTASKLQFAP